ncbi:hypothetical protein MHYP_G00339100 [Metynnis hypsauchen]
MMDRSCQLLPATRTTALSAGSSTESWLFRLRLSCLDKFQGRVSPLGPVVAGGHGDREPPDRSLRKERSLTHERSLRLSSSEEDMSPGPEKDHMESGEWVWGRRSELQSGTARGKISKKLSSHLVVDPDVTVAAVSKDPRSSPCWRRERGVSPTTSPENTLHAIKPLHRCSTEEEKAAAGRCRHAGTRRAGATFGASYRITEDKRVQWRSATIWKRSRAGREKSRVPWAC